LKIRSVKKTTNEHEKKQDSNERGGASQHFEKQECKKEHKETWKKQDQVSNAGLRTKTQPGSCRKRGKSNRKR
jgi:hypothetical protein